MVSTRSQTGTLSRVRYDLSTLRLVGERPLAEKGHHRVTKRSPKQTKFPAAVKRELPPLDDDLRDAIQELHNPDFMQIQSDDSDIPSFCPPFAFGDDTEMGLSAIQHADLRVERWETILKQHEEKWPHLVPNIRMRLEEVRAEREALVDNEANNRVIDHDKQRAVVQERIKVLEDFLAKSLFEPERENMRCAINGYRMGTIPYSTKYTLIYASRIVDTADTYADFTKDRKERLDRYAETYGGHWLWYERGLLVHPREAPRASLHVELARAISPTGLGCYWVTQAFKKRHDWVARMPTVIVSNPVPVPPSMSMFWRSTEDGMVACQKEGPRLCYNSLLDSGATFPSLHTQDFIDLGINPMFYSAQTLETSQTANGLIVSRSYEMYVTVMDDSGYDLVDPKDPVWPMAAKSLGGLCPVVECVDMPTKTPEGLDINHRLSGMLPFLACYISSVPTRNMIFLGEDRNDVLGAYRTMGQKRWDISFPHEVPGPRAAKLRLWGNPYLTFKHLNGRLVDQDYEDRPHASRLTYIAQDGSPGFVDSDPRAQARAAGLSSMPVQASAAQPQQPPGPSGPSRVPPMGP